MTEDDQGERPIKPRPKAEPSPRRDLEAASRRFVPHLTDHPSRLDREPDSAGISDTPVSAPLLLRPWPIEDENELSSLLEGATDGIETGLVRIDTRVACRPHGCIDLLAVDQGGQLAIVDFDPVSADALVLRALRHFDWVVQHLSLLRRIYAYVPANYARPPRLLLLAPFVSRATLRATRHFATPRLEWMRYQILDAAGAPAILFERLTVED